MSSRQRKVAKVLVVSEEEIGDPDLHGSAPPHPRIDLTKNPRLQLFGLKAQANVLTGEAGGAIATHNVFAADRRLSARALHLYADAVRLVIEHQSLRVPFDLNSGAEEKGAQLGFYNVLPHEERYRVRTLVIVHADVAESFPVGMERHGAKGRSVWSEQVQDTKRCEYLLRARP